MSFYSPPLPLFYSFNLVGNKDAWEKSGLCRSHTLPLLNDFFKKVLSFSRAPKISPWLWKNVRKRCTYVTSGKTMHFGRLLLNLHYTSITKMLRPNFAPIVSGLSPCGARRWNRKRKKKKRVKKKVNFQDKYWRRRKSTVGGQLLLCVRTWREEANLLNYFRSPSFFCAGNEGEKQGWGPARGIERVDGSLFW